MMKLKVKAGDQVKIVTGKDKGKSGKVIRVFRETGRVVVEGLNLHTKFKKSTKAGQPGEQIQIPGSIHLSNVMVIEPGTDVPTRIGYQSLADGTKQRVSRRSKQVIS